ncbi:hypothetical protein ACTIGL_22155 [Bacillus shihchuchen]|uniref:Uncharacterized protein n=1 Tax=Bacillus shihchuchen TaxID=3036942 RepID=A0ABT7KXK6_9BACI|nr:hypothetical protein [Bacillus shihchuchen]
MEFLIDLVKEFLKATVREVSAYFCGSNFWIRTTKNPLRAVTSKRVGSAKEITYNNHHPKR